MRFGGSNHNVPDHGVNVVIKLREGVWFSIPQHPSFITVQILYHKSLEVMFSDRVLFLHLAWSEETLMGDLNNKYLISSRVKVVPLL